MRSSPCLVSGSSRVQFHTSLSIWNTPASIVNGLSVLLGRSVLYGRRKSTGVGLKRLYCDLSGTGGPCGTETSQNATCAETIGAVKSVRLRPPIVDRICVTKLLRMHREMFNDRTHRQGWEKIQRSKD